MTDNLKKRSKILEEQTPYIHDRLKELWIDMLDLKNLKDSEIDILKSRNFRINNSAIPVNNWFFDQFKNNLIDSKDYIKLIRDNKIEVFDNDKGIRTYHLRNNRAYQDATKIQSFKCTLIGLPFDNSNLGKSPGVDYPNRSHPKKRNNSIKNIFSKVVNWWVN